MTTKTRIPLIKLRLSPRVYRALYTRHRIDYIDQIATKTDRQLLELQEIGQGALTEIKGAIEAYRRATR
jgi:DNA-directed RNA polymerase alpha subunit